MYELFVVYQSSQSYIYPLSAELISPTILGRWEKKWLMEFHPDKCQVLTITRKRQPVTYNYILNGHQLKHVSDAKYLGITFTNDMRWNQHIDNITAKANKTLHFLQRNVQISCPRLKTTAYQTLVRPTLEYATTVWDPHTKGNIYKIEMVQRRAARYVLHRYHNRSSVGEMLQHLNWPLLEVRRQHQRLAMLYKIHHGMVAVNKAQYLTPAARTSRHTHRSSYLVNEASTDYIRQSFFLRTVREWNSLPATVVDAPSLESFKARLVRGNAK